MEGCQRVLTVQRMIRFLWPVLRTSRIFHLEPGGSSKVAGPLPEGFRLIFPAESGYLSTDLIRDLDISMDELQRRLDAGDLLALVVHKGRGAHRTLVQTRGWAALEGCRKGFHLETGEAFIHYCMTSPACRGLGIYPRVLEAIASHLGAGGLRRLYIASNIRNEASAIGILKAGFRPDRTIRVAGCLGGRLAFRHDLGERHE